MIGVCTDSGARLPAGVADALGIEIVPLTITIGDGEFLEGVDVTREELDELLAGADASPLTMAEPSPGQFAAAYESLVERGCTQILSVHSSQTDCNAIGSARLAAHRCEVPVRLVDCASFGFGVGSCAWRAAELARSGGPLEGVAAEVERAASRMVHVCARGRTAEGTATTSYDVHSGIGSRSLPLLGDASDDTAADVMANYLLGHGVRRIGVGTAGSGAARLAGRVGDAIARRDPDVHVVPYTIGVAYWVSHGLPTVGCFALPAA